MADSVKISELPSLTVPDRNDVLIINDVSENTTKKITLNALNGGEQININLTFPSGLTCTQNGTTITSIPARITPFSTNIYNFSLNPNNLVLTFTNTTESEITLDLYYSGVQNLAFTGYPVTFSTTNQYGTGVVVIRSYGTFARLFYQNTNNGAGTITNFNVLPGQSATLQGFSINTLCWGVTLAS